MHSADSNYPFTASIPFLLDTHQARKRSYKAHIYKLYLEFGNDGHTHFIDFLQSPADKIAPGTQQVFESSRSWLSRLNRGWAASLAPHPPAFVMSLPLFVLVAHFPSGLDISL